MGIVGISSTIGTTSDFTVTRDQLIRIAHETIGAMEEGSVLSPIQLRTGIERLGLIVREVDEAGKWIWTREDAFHIPLVAQVSLYDANNGLKQNIAELISVVYRDASGYDSDPLNILGRESYEALTDKLAPGEPCSVMLTNDIDLSLRRLYIHPTPQTITAQSVVLGDDGETYRCTYPHTSASVTRPVSGANWRMVWELGGISPAAWVSGSAYTSGEHLRGVYRRPIYDFDAADSTPDFPMQWPRLIMLRLASDLADTYGIPQNDKETLQAKIKGAYTDIFSSTRQKTNHIHNKTQYF